jgi:hydrogenase maturation protease
MNSTPTILVAGIGNIFFGDDAFGTEVARHCAHRNWPDGVRIIDFGIRGLDLVYALLDGYDFTILVDAVTRGLPPGTLYLICPEIDSVTADNGTTGVAPLPAFDAHSMQPEKVLRYAQSLGANVSHVVLLGCEPMPLDECNDIQAGLSEPVAAAVETAIKTIRQLVNRLQHSPGDLTAEDFQSLLRPATASTTSAVH